MPDLPKLPTVVSLPACESYIDEHLVEVQVGVTWPDGSYYSHILLFDPNAPEDIEVRLTDAMLHRRVLRGELSLAEAWAFQNGTVDG